MRLIILKIFDKYLFGKAIDMLPISQRAIIRPIMRPSKSASNILRFVEFHQRAQNNSKPITKHTWVDAWGVFREKAAIPYRRPL